MCGIVGCIMKDNNNAAPVLLDCIKKLEYRGYDSVGIATISDEGISIRKDAGKIDNVAERINLKDMKGDYGIAHSRWATHGDPTKENAHPHTDEDGIVAVVHNGIIENYQELKESLELEGHTFTSQTDTEVIAHLLEKYIKKGLNLESALREVINIIKGAYAIAAVSSKEKEKIVATRKDSPLIVGLGKEGYFVASDSPAILKYARDVMYLEEGEIVTLTSDEVIIKNQHDQIVEKDIERINWEPEMAEKEGYDYFMIKEINEQAMAIRNTLTQRKNIENIVADLDDINRIIIVACGTSYHAGLTGKYLLENIGGIPVDVILASEFEFASRTLNKNTLAIFISQSGETADTLMALERAKKVSKTLAIVNAIGSSMTRKADHVIQTQAGPEIGVAATKTYVSQLTSIYLLTALLTENYELLERIKKVPGYMEETLDNAEDISKLANKYKYAEDFFFLGKGYAYPIALEGALKLKEITYIHAEGYAAGELKHGPLALIDTKTPIVVVSPPGEMQDKTMNSLEEVKARGADIIALGAEGDKGLINKSDDIFLVNDEVDELLAPLVYIAPLQLLSYYIALELGYDPDKPRNLAKSVTTG